MIINGPGALKVFTTAAALLLLVKCSGSGSGSDVTVSQGSMLGSHPKSQLQFTNPGSQSIISELHLTTQEPPSRPDPTDDNQPAAPGPLPLLGVGAAFGVSRKLRNRIKASSYKL